MVSDAVLVALATSVPPTLVALAAFVQAMRNGKAVGEIKDGMKTALDVAKVEKDNAKVAQATAEGQEKGRLLGESEAAARK